MSKLHLLIFRGLLPAFVFLIILSATSFAQQPAWTRYAADDGSFSALMPPGALIDAKKGEFGELFSIHAFAEDVDITLLAFKQQSFGPPPGDPEAQRFKVGKFTVSMTEKTLNGRLGVSITLSEEKKVYFFLVEGPDATNAAVVRAMLGLRVDSKPLLSQEKPENGSAESVAFSKLLTSPEVTEARERKIVNTRSEVVFEAKTTDDTPVQRPKNVRPAVIVERPSPNFQMIPSGLSTQLAANLGGAKTYEATVRVTLQADGQIGKIVFLGTPKGDFANEVEKAARKIRFVPAQIDGRNVDSEKIVQYSFISAVFSR